MAYSNRQMCTAGRSVAPEYERPVRQAGLYCRVGDRSCRPKAEESTLVNVLAKQEFFGLTTSRYNIGPQYYRAEFDVRIIVGAADVKFQLWGDDNHRLSRDHEDIEVSWNAPGCQRGASTMTNNTDNGLYALPSKSP